MIRFGQIGCGYWGPNLLRAIISLEEASIMAVCEIDPDRRRFLSKSFPSIELVKNSSEIFKNTQIDAVVIATQVQSHFALAKEALLNGKHVFVEKPMATTTEQIDELISLAKKYDLILFSGHTYLYHGVFRAIKEKYFDQLGDIFYCYSRRLNLGKIRTDINSWWNLAPHDVSMLIALMRKPPNKIAVNGSKLIQRDLEDISFATLEWDEGMIAHIHVSWLDPKKVRELTIVGSKKMLIFDDMADYKLRIYNKGIEKIEIDDKTKEFDEPSTVFSYRNSAMQCPVITYKEPLIEEMKHLCDCIEKKIEPYSGSQHTRMVVQTLEAGAISLKKGGEKTTIKNELIHDYSIS